MNSNNNSPANNPPVNITGTNNYSHNTIRTDSETASQYKVKSDGEKKRPSSKNSEGKSERKTKRTKSKRSKESRASTNDKKEKSEKRESRHHEKREAKSHEKSEKHRVLIQKEKDNVDSCSAT